MITGDIRIKLHNYNKSGNYFICKCGLIVVKTTSRIGIIQRVLLYRFSVENTTRTNTISLITL